MTTRRAYVSVANSHAIYDDAVLQGVGSVPATWPKGRSYYDVGRFRAPYQSGYYQDGSLQGLGKPLDSTAHAVDQNAPPNVKRFLVAGEPVPTLGRDAQLPFNQVSRLAYGILCVATLGISYVSYKQFKKRQRGNGAAGGTP